MIKIFCDCCGNEINKSDTELLSTTHFPAKRVSIEQYSSSIMYEGMTDFLVELIITANIYEPDGVLDTIISERLIGHNICADCVVKTLTQQKKR